MTFRDIVVAFGFKVDQNSEKNAENHIKGIKNFATKVLGAIGIGFSIAGICNLAETAAEVEALQSQFSQVFGEVEEEASKKLGAIAENTGVSVNRMKGSFVQIAAFAKTSGMEAADALELSNRSLQAVADSAAFYDRSLEEVTNSLQSFLKGNFENDAALGLSCTETTRNAAANALYGKSFIDLAEDQKQLTLLKMVEDANKASGALGQAARESDTWTNQLGNLNQSLTDLKAVVGSTFLKPAVLVLKMLNTLVQKVTRAVEGLTAEHGLLTRVTERYQALVKRLQPAIDRMTSNFSKGFNRDVEIVKQVIERLGGMEQVLKILAIVAGAFLLTMNWSKMLSGASKFVKLLSGIGKLFSGIGKLFSFAHLKVLAIVAVIVTLALIVEDLIAFLMGKDSMLGSIFDQMGIGADRAREWICQAFEKGKAFLLKLGDFLKSVAMGFLEALRDSFSMLFTITRTIFQMIGVVIQGIFQGIQVFWNHWGSQILTWFQVVWNSIGGILHGFLEVVKGVINFLTSGFTGDWQGVWEAAKQIFVGIWEIMVNFLSTIWETMKLLFFMGLSAIQSVWSSMWEAIGTFFREIWNGIAAFGNRIFETMLAGITDTIGKVKKTIVDGFTVAIDWIKELPSQALQWGMDIIDGIVNGIKGAISKVTDAVGDVAGTIKSFLHFSVPDEGPLTDYESWMPDFMNGLAAGLEGSSDVLFSVITRIGTQIQEAFISAFDGAEEIVSARVNYIGESIKSGLEMGVILLQSLPPQAMQWGMDFIHGLRDGILSGVDSIENAVKSVGERIQSYLHFSVSDIGLLTDYESWMPDFMNGLAAGLEGSSNVLFSVITRIGIQIQEAFISAFDGAEEIVSARVNYIGESIKSGLEMGAIFLQSLPPQATQWGMDFMDGLRDGILSGVDSIGDAVKGVAERIRSYLHFSVPDIGPLMDYEHWMPDFMGGLAKGIGENETLVLDKIRSLASGIAMLTQAATVSAATVSNSTIQNTTSNLTQNVNISNSYSGGSMETQRKVSKAMKRSAEDATTYLARGLAYVRG